MSDNDLDQPDEPIESVERPPHPDKSIEETLTKIRESDRVQDSLQEGAQLDQQIVAASKEKNFEMKEKGILETPVQDLYINGQLKDIPREAQKEVVRELEVLKEVQKYREKGFEEKDFAKMGKEYHDVYRQYYTHHIQNIRGMEYQGKVLIEAGRTRSAYAKEMGFATLPVRLTSLEAKEKIEN